MGAEVFDRERGLTVGVLLLVVIGGMTGFLVRNNNDSVADRRGEQQ
jgi:hypothetical protein